MIDADSPLAAVRADVQAGRAPGPAVRNAIVAIEDPAVARKVGRLLDRPGVGHDDLRPIRVALVATCTIGAFEPLLRACLVGVGSWPTFVAGEYGAFEMTLASGAFTADGDPDIAVCLMDESYFLPRDWDPTALDALEEYVLARAADLGRLVEQGLTHTSATMIVHTIPLPAEVRDAVISWAGKARVARIWNRLNAALLDLAVALPQVAIVDLVSVLADAPFAARDDRLHRYADMPYTDGALLMLAREVRRIGQALAGLSRKVLALDLDNTLWGGVLGETGASGVSLGGLYPGNCYLQLQRTALRLRAQGVILVLASKNDAELVDDALTKHPDVLLRPAAFSALAVNWSAKAGNLRQAAESLGVATNAFVFMDDSPFEREQVADELPEIALVASDGDPAHMVRSLLRDGWFDVVELTETDRQRPELYRTRAMRGDFSQGFGSSEEYLRALDIELIAERVDEFAVGRVAQLAARTNQFNLTGIRFDAAATADMAGDDGHLVASFSVSDRFGSEGIVGAAWVRCGEVWQVENLVLSCRVLGRGVELAIAGWIAGQARAAGAKRLRGRFVPSGKNHVASGFWEKAGFLPTDDHEAFTGELDRVTELVPTWVRIREGKNA